MPRRAAVQEWGLLPPDNSPYVGGRVAPNANLLQVGAGGLVAVLRGEAGRLLWHAVLLPVAVVARHSLPPVLWLDCCSPLPPFPRQLEGQWRQQYAGVIEEQRSADEALAQRRAAAATEAAARRAAVAEAQRQAAETAAAVAAAANPMLALQMQQAALAGQAGLLPMGLMQQMMQQGGRAAAAAGTLPIVG